LKTPNKMNSIFKNFVLVILLFTITDASAQFGIRAKYNLNSFSEWDNWLDESTTGDIDKIFPTTIELGVDYWFRLKNHRIEFMPELAMGLKTNSTYSNLGADADFSYFAFILNTQIYAFDLTGDCDCPTFSKQGPSLKKGFFFNIAPGLIYNTKELNLENTMIPPTETNQINLRLGVGVGYDIGFSDLFTITPSIMYNIAPGIKFDALDFFNPTSSARPTSGLNQIQFQLRFGFRPDYVKSYGRGRR